MTDTKAESLKLGVIDTGYNTGHQLIDTGYNTGYHEGWIAGTELVRNIVELQRELKELQNNLSETFKLESDLVKQLKECRQRYDDLSYLADEKSRELQTALSKLSLND
jgi:hypothetical protein